MISVFIVLIKETSQLNEASYISIIIFTMFHGIGAIIQRINNVCFAGVIAYNTFTPILIFVISIFALPNLFELIGERILS